MASSGHEVLYVSSAIRTATAMVHLQDLPDSNEVNSLNPDDHFRSCEECRVVYRDLESRRFKPRNERDEWILALADDHRASPDT